MDDASFAHSMNAWLDPFDVIKAGHLYETDKPEALKWSTLVFANLALGDGNDGNYPELAAKYMKGFCLHEELLRLLQVIEGGHLSNDTWAWLSQLSLDPVLRAGADINLPVEQFPVKPVLLVSERDAILDLCRAPLSALLGLVSGMSQTWRQVAIPGMRIFHQPTMPTAFFSYVDRRVGEAYISFLPPQDVAGEGAINRRYRAVTVVGRQPLEDVTWEAAQFSARHMAESTLTAPKGEWNEPARRVR